jgi:hypothetical protein
MAKSKVTSQIKHFDSGVVSYGLFYDYPTAIIYFSRRPCHRLYRCSCPCSLL